MRSSIHINLPPSAPCSVWVSDTGYYLCTLYLLSTLFFATGGLSSMLHCNIATNRSGKDTYSTLWDSKVYEAYAKYVEHVSVVLVDVYTDDETLPKSVAQRAAFYRVRF